MKRILVASMLALALLAGTAATLFVNTSHAQESPKPDEEPKPEQPKPDTN